jgi:hypothetical protein
VVLDVADPQGYLGRSLRGHDNAQAGDLIGAVDEAIT